MSVARSDKVTGPYTGNYTGNPGNPVLTHRNLGRDHPIVGTGDADLVQLPDGTWWAVLLAMRPHGGYRHNLGRGTFVVPVVWEDGWPVFAPGVGRLSARFVPPLAAHPWPVPAVRDEFTRDRLAISARGRDYRLTYAVGQEGERDLMTVAGGSSTRLRPGPSWACG